MYAERFNIFIKITLVAHAPWIALALLNRFGDKYIDWNHVSDNQVIAILVPLLLVLSTMMSQLAGHCIMNAVTVPIVLQSIAAPLRPIKISSAIAALKRRWVVFTILSFMVVLMKIVGLLLFVLPGIFVSMAFALYAPVVIMENYGIRGSIKRSFNLMKRSWTTVLAISILQIAIPMAFSFSSTHVDAKVSSSDVHFNLGISGNLTQLLNVFVAPLTAIMTALLYLKMRYAGGEGMGENVEKFEAQEMPTTKWQQKMSSRMKL